jgi:hypothetical protein
MRKGNLQTRQIVAFWTASATAVVWGACAGVGRADKRVGFSRQARGAQQGF